MLPVMRPGAAQAKHSGAGLVLQCRRTAGQAAALRSTHRCTTAASGCRKAGGAPLGVLLQAAPACSEHKEDISVGGRCMVSRRHGKASTHNSLAVLSAYQRRRLMHDVQLMQTSAGRILLTMVLDQTAIVHGHTLLIEPLACYLRPVKGCALPLRVGVDPKLRASFRRQIRTLSHHAPHDSLHTASLLIGIRHSQAMGPSPPARSQS